MNGNSTHEGNIQKHLDDLKNVIEGTRGDKYNQGSIEVVDFIHDKQLGFNLGNAVKYITRYKATQGEKNGNPNDLLKAAHYVLIELSQHEKNHGFIRKTVDKATMKFIEMMKKMKAMKKTSTVELESEPDVEVEDVNLDGPIVLDGKEYPCDPIFFGDHISQATNPANIIPQGAKIEVVDEKEMKKETQSRPTEQVVSSIVSDNGSPIVYDKMKQEVITEDGYEELKI